MISERYKKSLLLLGSIAFVNHDCKSNCAYISLDKNLVGLITLKDIQIGEEITTYYGSNYFGEKNILCECLNCEETLKEETLTNLNLQLSKIFNYFFLAYKFKYYYWIICFRKPIYYM